MALYDRLVPRRSDDLMHPERPLIGIRLYREGQVMPQSAITTPNLEKGREDLGLDRAVLATFGRRLGLCLEPAIIHASLVLAGEADTLLSHGGVTLSAIRLFLKWSYAGIV